MLEDIRFRLNDSEHIYFCATEEETRHMISLIDKYKESTERIKTGLTRMSTGEFSAPMEYSQVEAYQEYAKSLLETVDCLEKE